MEEEKADPVMIPVSLTPTTSESTATEEPGESSAMTPLELPSPQLKMAPTPKMKPLEGPPPKGKGSGGKPSEQGGVSAHARRETGNRTNWLEEEKLARELDKRQRKALRGASGGESSPHGASEERSEQSSGNEEYEDGEFATVGADEFKATNGANTSVAHEEFEVDEFATCGADEIKATSGANKSGAHEEFEADKCATNAAAEFKTTSGAHEEFEVDEFATCGANVFKATSGADKAGSTTAQGYAAMVFSIGEDDDTDVADDQSTIPLEARTNGAGQRLVKVTCCRRQCVSGWCCGFVDETPPPTRPGDEGGWWTQRTLEEFGFGVKRKVLLPGVSEQVEKLCNEVPVAQVQACDKGFSREDGPCSHTDEETKIEPNDLREFRRRLQELETRLLKDGCAAETVTETVKGVWSIAVEKAAQDELGLQKN